MTLALTEYTTTTSPLTATTVKYKVADDQRSPRRGNVCQSSHVSSYNHITPPLILQQIAKSEA